MSGAAGDEGVEIECPTCGVLCEHVGDTYAPVAAEAPPEAAAAPPAMTRANWIGAPAFFNLNQACYVVAEAFGWQDGGVYLVGSSLERRDYRDVDVRVILEDEAFARLFPLGGGSHDALWSLMCASISLYLAQHSGLPIDFQIQQQTKANADPHGRRHALGIFMARAREHGAETSTKLTPAEAALIIGCHVSAVRQAVDRGTLTAVRQGKLLFLDPEEVRRYRKATTGPQRKKGP